MINSVLLPVLAGGAGDDMAFESFTVMLRSNQAQAVSAGSEPVEALRSHRHHFGRVGPLAFTAIMAFIAPVLTFPIVALRIAGVGYYRTGGDLAADDDGHSPDADMREQVASWKHD
jgi:hypothetical protein